MLATTKLDEGETCAMWPHRQQTSLPPICRLPRAARLAKAGDVCMRGGGYAPSDRPSKRDGRHIPSGRRRVSDELDACVV